MEQLILNLIINGGEAIGERKGILSVKLSDVTMSSDELAPFGRITHTTLKEGRYAMLVVSDTGVGISQQAQAKIFEPFFTTKFTGRGLGLSAVLGIVQGHHGGITVESQEGVGTTVRIVIGACAAPETIGETPDVNEEPVPHSATTILVIDDEQDVAMMAQEILEMDHYTAVVELSPIRAIEIYRRRQAEIGVVLLDLTMPEMSGKEVVDALQAIDPNVKIILTSGYSEEEVTKKIIVGKVSAFIQKPYRMASLLTLVRNVLGGR
jgi:CheY-like chemotaxis protein